MWNHLKNLAGVETSIADAAVREELTQARIGIVEGDLCLPSRYKDLAYAGCRILNEVPDIRGRTSQCREAGVMPQGKTRKEKETFA